MQNKLFYAVPIVVLRKFMEMNKNVDDTYAQVFEPDPNFIFTEEELKQVGSKLEENGAVIYNLDNLGE